MTLAALNTWRRVYLAEVIVALLPAGSGKRSVYQQSLKITLIAGAGLWLMHDLAHGRWHIAVADGVALLGCLSGQPPLTIAGVAYAVTQPERPPSPFIWSRQPPRDTS